MSWGYSWRPYVTAASRKHQAAKRLKQLEQKSGEKATPVQASGRDIASSFWGKAWCRHIENLSDYENRLPRGRTYLRNGSVIDLKIVPGQVRALVSGSEIYQIRIHISALEKSRWNRLKTGCANSVASLLDLLQGKFDDGVMRRLTDPRDGIFPKSAEFKLHCSCPDSAYLCKHLAAVLYGVGARLDTAPELLFTLRMVDHLELIGTALDAGHLDQALQGSTSPGLEGADLGDLFGIELDTGAGEVAAAAAPAARGGKRTRRPAAKKSAGTGKAAASARAKPEVTAPVVKPRRGSRAISKEALPVAEAAPVRAKGKQAADKAKPARKPRTPRAMTKAAPVTSAARRTSGRRKKPRDG